MADISSPDERHRAHMRLALTLAQQSPPKPTNFRVGAVLVDADTNAILSTGYTLELPGNTHAEQCCLAKLATQHDLPEDEIGSVLPPHSTVLYTTMEPCAVRLSGNMPCVDRIIQTKKGGSGGIKTVYSGVREPETFVGENKGRKTLTDAGIECVYISGLEDDILKVATAGHTQTD